MPVPSPRRKSFAYLLLLVGGFLGAHRFYLGSYLGGAAQLLLLLVGTSSLPVSRFSLGLLVPWLLLDIYWVHVRLAREGGARPKAARTSMAKDYDLAALDEADKLRERFATAAAAREWAKAEALSEQIVATARKVFKGPHQNLAMSLCMHGQACYQLKAFDKAKASLEESLAIGRRIGMPAEDMEIARKALAMTLAGIGEHDNTVRQRHAASPPDSSTSPGGDTVLLNLLEDQEKRYKAAFERRDLPLAERLCADAVYTSRQLCGGSGKAVVLHLMSHAEFCRQLQWHDKTEALLDECLAMIGQLGLDDGWRLRPTHTLALLRAAAGQSDEAETLCKKSIAMAVALSKGNSTDDVVRAIHNLAFFYASTDQDQKADLCYARAVVHLDKLPAGEGDADLHADLLINFAQLYMARSDVGKARPLFERALAIQERSCRGISTSAATAHNDLGLIAQEEGDLRQALEHFERALLLDRICVPDHFERLANAQRNIDNVSLTLAAVARAARLEPST